MLRSVLISPDANTARTIARVFKDLEVTLEHTADAGVVFANDPKRRFDAIVVDDSIDDAAAILEKVVTFPGCSKAVRIVLADPGSPSQAIFKASAQVVFYKPISAERVRHGLRAVRNLMGRDRRRGAKRVTTMIPVRIRYGRSSGGQLFIADLSDSGAALQCGAGDLPSAGSLHMDFALPGEAERIHVTAELMWQNNEGCAGVRFLDMAMSARKKLGHWVKEQTVAIDKSSLYARAGL
jgi:PilZ domain-containing protein